MELLSGKSPAVVVVKRITMKNILITSTLLMLCSTEIVFAHSFRQKSHELKQVFISNWVCKASNCVCNPGTTICPGKAEYNQKDVVTESSSITGEREYELSGNASFEGGGKWGKAGVDGGGKFRSNNTINWSYQQQMEESIKLETGEGSCRQITVQWTTVKYTWTDEVALHSWENIDGHCSGYDGHSQIKRRVKIFWDPYESSANPVVQYCAPKWNKCNTGKRTITTNTTDANGDGRKMFHGDGKTPCSTNNNGNW